MIALVTKAPVIVTKLVVLLQPVPESVNVNVAVPADTPVTNPAFVTVAMAVLLLTHVPPVEGLSVMVEPTQSVVAGVLTVGGALIVIDDVVLLQPVPESVNVNVTVPADTPVTNPAFVTVAMALLLLTHVPPVEGVKVMVAPTHKVVSGALTVGCCTEIKLVVLIQPVPESVNVNVTVPADTPVTNPAFVTVAIALLLLTHVPPLEGLKVIVAPTQRLAEGALTIGNALMVIDDVALLQPVPESVNVKVTEPADTPVTTPAFVTVAIALLLLTQVPPLDEVKVMVVPTHRLVEGALTAGC